MSPNTFPQTLINFLTKTAKARELSIRVFGNVFHKVLSGGSPSIAVTADKYARNTGLVIQMDANSRDVLDNFMREESGIMIASHGSGFFTDYLPIFRELGESMLRSTEFYTGSYNLAMNKGEFPNYTFTNANLSHDTEKGSKGKTSRGPLLFGAKKKPFQFWMDYKHSKGFLNGLKRLIHTSTPDETPILLIDVTHSGPMGYVDVLKARARVGVGNILGKGAKGIGTTTLSFRLITAGDVKGKRGNELRTVWDERF